jgi:DNA polymerase V
MYALVDCNNFYASCERLFRPDLRSKPVVVLSNNDGCVIARSDEAKQLGIPMGAPAFRYRALFKKHQVAVFSSNYALYGDMSRRVMSVLSSMVPGMEIYSIDEAFLVLDGIPVNTLEDLGRKIKIRVQRETGIPISVGMASSQSLAKLANRIAKKFADRTGGVYLIDGDEKRIKALKWLEIGDVWGIGGSYAGRLRASGINTAFDFTLQPDNWVKKYFSVVGLRLKHDLEGKPTVQTAQVVEKKNIATTRSFERMYTRFDELKERIVTFAVSCAEKLRAQNSCCRSMMVFIHTNGFRADLEQYAQNIVLELPVASNSGIELARYAINGLKCLFKEGYQYKKAGVIVMDLVPENEVQGNLFFQSNQKHVLLMKSIDRVNQRMGQQKVKLASQDLNRTWKMKQDLLSPRYTTRLSEIISVKASCVSTVDKVKTPWPPNSVLTQQSTIC